MEACTARGRRASADPESLVREYLETRDPRLKERIVSAYCNFVRSIAGRFSRNSDQREDLIQTAWIEFWRALERFDTKQETRFSTYVGDCMIGALKRYFRDNTWGISVPRSQRELAAKLTKKAQELARDLGRDPTDSELAVAAGVSDEALANAHVPWKAYRLISLSDLEGAEDTAMYGYLAYQDPRLSQIVEREAIRAILNRLGPRERTVIEKRYLEDCETQKEVGRELGCSQMTVSRYENKALKQLRDLLESSSIAE